MSNLEVYLVESDPNDSAINRRALKVEILSDSIHQFSFIESLDLTDRGLTSVLESSTDLANWDEVMDQTQVSNTRDNPSGVRIEFHQYTARSSQVTHEDCILE